MFNYQRLRTISSDGRYGHVFSVRHKVTCEYFVAKEFNRRGLPAGQKECGFLDALAGSDHIIKKVTEFENSGERLALTVLYEAMPAAISLRRFLDERNRPPSLSQIKRILHQILEGLADSHRLGIVHRDLRPSKILVSRNGDQFVVKLIDFRDAMNHTPEEPVTPMRAIPKVNLFYTSPEELLGSSSYGTPVDMWAVGCIMAEMEKGGKVLFEGINVVEAGDSGVRLIEPRKQDLESRCIGQLYKIFSFRGTRSRLPAYLPQDLANALDWENVPKFRIANLLREFPVLGVSGNRLLARLLSYTPTARMTAEAALQHEFFNEGAIYRRFE